MSFLAPNYFMCDKSWVCELMICCIVWYCLWRFCLYRERDMTATPVYRGITTALPLEPTPPYSILGDAFSPKYYLRRRRYVYFHWTKYRVFTETMHEFYVWRVHSPFVEYTVLLNFCNFVSFLFLYIITQLLSGCYLNFIFTLYFGKILIGAFSLFDKKKIELKLFFYCFEFIHINFIIFQKYGLITSILI